MKRMRKILATILTLAICSSLNLSVLAKETDSVKFAEQAIETTADASINAVAPEKCIGNGQAIGTTRVEVKVNVTEHSSRVMLRACVTSGSGTYDCYVTTPNGVIYKIGTDISCNKGFTPYFLTQAYEEKGTYTFTFHISNSDRVGCLAWIYKPYYYQE